MANSSNNPLKSAGSLVDEKEFASKPKASSKKSSGSEAASADRVKLVAAVVCLCAAGALIAWQLELFGGGRGTGAVPAGTTAGASSGGTPGPSGSSPAAASSGSPESFIPKPGTKLVAPDGTKFDYVAPPPASRDPIKK